MTYRRFSPGFSEMIVSLVRDVSKGSDFIDRNARLTEYRLEDISHNLDYISREFDQNDLLRSVIERSSTYTSETDKLFLFKNGIITPDYDSRLSLLVNDLNYLRLRNRDDLKSQYNIWCYYVSNSLSQKEIKALSRDNAERITSEGRIRRFFREYFFPGNFRNAQEHLKARAKKADAFIDNIVQLCSDVGTSLELQR